MYVGEIINEQSDSKYLVKLSTGPWYVVGVWPTIPKEKLKVGTWVT